MLTTMSCEGAYGCKGTTFLGNSGIIASSFLYYYWPKNDLIIDKARFIFNKARLILDKAWLIFNKGSLLRDRGWLSKWQGSGESQIRLNRR
jgi:hypothetical protein